MTDRPKNQQEPEVQPSPVAPGATDAPQARSGILGRDLPPLPDEAMGPNPRAGWLDPRAWFPDPSAPLEIEIGSGKGTFLVQQAELKPEVNYLGIEWAGEFFRHAADRCDRRGLANARVLYTDATEFVRYRVPSGLVRTIHLYFSDPWPKKRHHKNRVVQDRFLIDAWRVLEDGGQLRIVTDHDDYWAWMQEHIARFTNGRRVVGDAAPVAGCCAYEPSGFEPVESAGAQELVGSNFERKYRLEGRPFHGIVLRKVRG